MSCCCKPQVKVIASTVIDAVTLTLTINKLFTSIGGNSGFCLCIPFGMIPDQVTAFTNAIFIFDGVTTVPATLVCTGNNLHVDSLRSFFLRNVCRECCNRNRCLTNRQVNGCCTYNFNCFYGIDVPHVTFCHKMCPSIVGTGSIPTTVIGSTENGS